MKLKIVIISLSIFYIAGYIGLRTGGEIIHIERTSELVRHSVVSKPRGWDALTEAFDDSQKTKRSITNKVYYPLRKVEELFWNIVM